MTGLFEGEVYIVTGGSKGFGLAIAEGLVAHGARVALISRNQEKLDQAIAQIGSEAALGFAADVADAAAINSAFSAIRSHFGRLDGLINNAGLARPSRIETLEASEVALQVNTNFLGTVFCCQAAIPLLRGADNPRIINISSASAWHYDEMAHLSIYASTKAAVERFSRDLRLELQKDKIGVTCIRPGGAMTDFAAQWDEQKLSAALADWKDLGAYMDIGMEVVQVAEAVRYALLQPVGVGVDLLEIRPNTQTSKSIF